MACPKCDELRETARQIRAELDRRLNDPQFSQFYRLWRLCGEIAGSSGDMQQQAQALLRQASGLSQQALLRLFYLSLNPNLTPEQFTALADQMIDSHRRLCEVIIDEFSAPRFPCTFVRRETQPAAASKRLRGLFD